MTDTPQVSGDIITYLDTSDPDRGEFRRALLTGVGVVDPQTGITWVAIIAAGHGLTLLDPDLIVDSGLASAERSPAVVDVLGGALAVLVSDLNGVPEHGSAVLDLVDRFIAVFTPIQGPLAALADADPLGPLATVLACVGGAAQHFANGRFVDGKAGILNAHAILSELVEPGPDGSP